MFATHHYESMLLNTFRGVAAVGVNNLFVGLYLTSPTNSGKGGIEINYTGYVRQPIQFIAPYAEGERVGVRNADSLLWNVSQTDVGEAKYIGISDSPIPGSGNMLLYGELTIPLEIRANQQPSVSQGSIRYFMLGDHTREYKTRALNVLRGQTFSGFQSHMALFNGDPQDGGVELSGEAYARVTVSFSPPSVQIGDHSQIFSTETVEFPEPLAEWGSWVYSGIMESATGGLPMVALARPEGPDFLHRGYQPVFNAGSVSVALD
ncbi:MAG: hypothetical protein FWE20_11640 [Defluviitaleaceae bacterium]|nr:hypothetical protein [Defluviitaleaceae bacterium]